MRTYLLLLCMLNFCACGAERSHRGQSNKSSQASGQSASERLNRQQPSTLQQWSDLRIEVTSVDLGRFGKQDGTAAWQIQNQGTQMARLHADATISRHEGQRWVATAVKNFKVRYDCDQPPTGCVDLVPGATLVPPAWNGCSQSPQCGPSCPWTELQGEYRITVQSCDQSHQVHTEAFRWR